MIKLHLGAPVAGDGENPPPSGSSGHSRGGGGGAPTGWLLAVLALLLSLRPRHTR